MSKAKRKNYRVAAREEFAPWDSAENLKTPEEVAVYLRDMIANGGDDPEVFATALGTAARAYGMMKLSQEVGLSRQGLHKALSKNGNPRLDTVLKVTRALGVRLTAEST